MSKIEFKKSLVALGVLAASGAAMAQSTVTVYGLIDLALGHVEKTGVGTKTELASGGVNGSRWGVRGSEDLGGGLKANFKLLAGLNADSGTAGMGGIAFGRESTVGLSGGFGEVNFGRIETPFDNVTGDGNALWDSSYFSPGELLFRSQAYTARPNNTFYYQSPSMAGVSTALSYSLGENATTSVDAGSIASGNVAYRNGPLKLSAAYQVEKATDASTSVKYTRANIAYTVGAATLKAMYGNAANIGAVSGADANEWELGVDYNVGSAWTFTGSVATSSDNATAGNFDRKGWGVAAKYAFSKRTFLYGGYESDTTTKAAVADVDHSMLLVGMQHRF